jgi:hypothetical protein
MTLVTIYLIANIFRENYAVKIVKNSDLSSEINFLTFYNIFAIFCQNIFFNRNVGPQVDGQAVAAGGPRPEDGDVHVRAHGTSAGTRRTHHRGQNAQRNSGWGSTCKYPRGSVL